MSEPIWSNLPCATRGNMKVPGYNDEKIVKRPGYEVGEHGSERDYLRLVRPERVTAEQLASRLKELRSEPFLRFLEHLRDGREHRVLSTNSIVRSLVNELKSCTSAQSLVESFLDEVFEAFVPGEHFDDSDVVIALLFAVHGTQEAWGRRIIDAFAQASAGELAWVRRYARRLIR